MLGRVNAVLDKIKSHNLFEWAQFWSNAYITIIYVKIYSFTKWGKFLKY